MIILTVRSGQLCNRLIQFAHLIAFCKERNLRVVNLAFTEYAQYFNSTHERLFISFPPFDCKLRNRFIRVTLQKMFHILGFFSGRLMSRLPGVVLVKFNDERASAESVQKLESELGKRLIFLEGWYFRDPRDCSKYAEEIKRYFEPREKYTRAAQEIHSEIRRDCDLVIGLHIRRGDYKWFKGGKYYFDDQVYVKIIQALIAEYPDKRIKVFVASDEPLELQNYVPVSERVIYERRAAVVDLMALSLCDYIVGPPSTFTIWASFYGKVPLVSVEDPEEPIDLAKAHPASI